jgi:hypothetical protein
VSGRQYDGPALDGTVQHISEATYWQGDGETVDVVDNTPVGEERTEGVPVPDGGAERPDVDEDRQTRLDEWRWSA